MTTIKDEIRLIQHVLRSFRPLGRIGDPADALRRDLLDLQRDVDDVIERDRIDHGGETPAENEDDDHEEWKDC